MSYLPPMQQPLVNNNISIDNNTDTGTELLASSINKQTEGCDNLSNACWCYIYFVIGINIIGFIIGMIFIFLK